ncbi:aminotransferase class IV [Lujinxingia vulgaris]|nr:aminotransferase class IV [Lujinxingia vulgaris]
MMMEDDRSFLYGDGLFETVRVEASHVRFLDRHCARLRRSGRALGFDEAQIEEGCALLATPPGPEGLWRVTVSRRDPAIDFGGSGRVCGRWRPGLPALSPPALVTMPGFYMPGDALAEHKTTSWLRSVELRRRAQLAGADDGVGVSENGKVGECSAANLLVLLEDRWVTPPVRGILPGITREVLLERASAAEIPLKEAKVTLKGLGEARALALLSTGVGVLEARSIDERALEMGCTAELKAMLEDV